MQESVEEPASIGRRRGQYDGWGGWILHQGKSSVGDGQCNLFAAQPDNFPVWPETMHRYACSLIFMGFFKGEVALTVAATVLIMRPP